MKCCSGGTWHASSPQLVLPRTRSRSGHLSGERTLKHAKRQNNARSTKLESITLRSKKKIVFCCPISQHCVHCDIVGVGSGAGDQTYLRGHSRRSPVQASRQKRTRGCFAFTCAHGHWIRATPANATHCCLCWGNALRHLNQIYQRGHNSQSSRATPGLAQAMSRCQPMKHTRTQQTRTKQCLTFPLRLTRVRPLAKIVSRKLIQKP